METFSYTRISTFTKCPKAYELRYIKGLEEEFDTIERFMGNIVHQTLEWSFTKGYRTLMDLDKVRSQYRSIWDKSISPSVRVIKRRKTQNEYFELGDVMLREYYHTLHQMEQDETLELECKFSYPIKKDIEYNGIIDRITQKPDGTICLTDYKTGSMRDYTSNVYQLKSYAWYAFDAYETDLVKLRLDYLKENDSKEIGYTREEAKDEIIPFILSKVKEIHSTSFYDKRKSILCDWCGYKDICKQDIGDEGEVEDICPRCGSDLEQRNGRFGTFIGCSNYPRCRYTRDEW